MLLFPKLWLICMPLLPLLFWPFPILLFICPELLVLLPEFLCPLFCLFLPAPDMVT